jgi:Secretion system C-terminal sorting domain
VFYAIIKELLPVFNSSDSTWVFSIYDTTGIITFDYSLLIDCSIIQDTVVSNRINLNQTWSCSGCNTFFDLNSTANVSNTLITAGNPTPFITDVSALNHIATWHNGSPKPPYPGQPAYGTTSSYGIQLNHTIINIGDGNSFNTLNNGIFGVGSVIKVKGNLFRNIRAYMFYQQPSDGVDIVAMGDGMVHGRLEAYPSAMQPWTFTLDGSQARQLSSLQQNNLVSSDELPYSSEKNLNYIDAFYSLYGMDSMVTNYSQLLLIASQCPYQGGPSVYRARVLVILFTDTISYDDASVCSQLGYIRQQESTVNKDNPEISVLPNPTRDQVEIIFPNSCKDDYLIRITDVTGKQLRTIKHHCSEGNSKIVDVSTIPSGVYWVVFSSKNQRVHIHRMVIIK